jgi:prepilin-type N-terminal cleavage/methylation domain-containing protein
MNISNHCPLAPRRRAFTLIELLMVISIIAVLSSLAVGLLLSARDDASAARTRSIIARCQAVLNARLENYEARNMPFRYEDVLPSTTTAEKKRCYDNTIIEWLLVEMPSVVSDFDGSNTFPRKPPYNGYPEYVNALNNRLTSMHQANRDYLTRYGGSANFASFAQAKLLYMVLYNSWDADNRGTHFLQPSEIKIDNGIPYVVDAFGDELSFQIGYRPNASGPLVPLATAHLAESFPLEDVEILITSKNLK